MSEYEPLRDVVIVINERTSRDLCRDLELSRSTLQDYLRHWLETKVRFVSMLLALDFSAANRCQDNDIIGDWSLWKTKFPQVPALTGKSLEGIINEHARC